MEKKVRKQNSLSLKIKIELLQAVNEAKRSKTEICKHFGIPNSTLSTILKNRDKILELYQSSKFEPDRKRFRTANHENLETALVDWFKQARSQGARISGPLLMRKANVFAEQMNLSFCANNGWLERFKKRNGVTFKNTSRGESRGVPQEKTPSSLQQSTTLQAILKDCPQKDISNAYDTGLLFRRMSDKTLSSKGEQCSLLGLTVMVSSSNADGLEIPSFVINCTL